MLWIGLLDKLFFGRFPTILNMFCSFSYENTIYPPNNITQSSSRRERERGVNKKNGQADDGGHSANLGNPG